jgi:hypothetical protein
VSIYGTSRGESGVWEMWIVYVRYWRRIWISFLALGEWISGLKAIYLEFLGFARNDFL